jgi:hypothetical protein
MCEVGYVRQYNVPPLSFHVTLITILFYVGRPFMRFSWEVICPQFQRVDKFTGIVYHMPC